MGTRDQIAGKGGIADRCLKLFLEKSKDYGDESHEFMGAVGQFSDIYRKIIKLKRALVDGVELQGEQPVEILMDLVAHCWLTIAMLERDLDGREVQHNETAHIIGAMRDMGWHQDKIEEAMQAAMKYDDITSFSEELGEQG